MASTLVWRVNGEALQNLEEALVEYRKAVARNGFGTDESDILADAAEALLEAIRMPKTESPHQ